MNLEDFQMWADQRMSKKDSPGMHSGIPIQAYCALALCGETGELVEAVGEGIPEKALLELGDCLFYFSQLLQEYRMPLQTVAYYRGTFAHFTKDQLLLRLVSVTGRLSESVKKFYRDDKAELTFSRSKAITACAQDIMALYASIAFEYGRDLESVMDMLRTKLEDRDKRKVTYGDGDKR